MLTVVEMASSTARWPEYWSDDDCSDFVAFLSANPLAGEVIPGAGGCRKVRWSRPGRGKRGGVRVIYLNRLAEERIVLMLLYAKNQSDSISPFVLRRIAEELKCP